MPIRQHVFVISALIIRHVVGSSVVVCRFIASHLGPLLVHLSYFVTIDLLGFLALVLLNKAPKSNNSNLRYIDLFFMSTSAVTVTGLATVRMEALSSAQMVVLTVLMLLGSEVFVSLLRLVVPALSSSSRNRKQPQHGLPDHHDGSSRVRSVVTVHHDDEEANNRPQSTTTMASMLSTTDDPNNNHDQKMSCSCLMTRRLLALVVLAYMLVVLLIGSLLVFVYVSHVPSARDVLARKSISVALFSASVTVSSFANGGLLPTNEGMAVFATSQGLLLLLAGQILAGGTLFPVLLRLVLRATRGLVARVSPSAAARPGGGHEDDDMAKDAMAVGFTHLLPGSQTAFVAATAVAVAAAAVTLFCFLNWDTAVFAGLTTGEKVTNALFMAVNARQAGENSVDCSLIAPAVLVLFVAMMCTPASASFFLVHDGGGGEISCGREEELERNKDGAKRRSVSLSNRLWSPLVFKAAAVMLVCITERRSLSSDPLNFSTFSMIFEVISAYRNVGLSIGYSCSRLLRPEEASACHDQPYSFSGWWSDQGKLLLVLLMLCGRLKGFCKQRRRS